MLRVCAMRVFQTSAEFVVVVRGVVNMSESLCFVCYDILLFLVPRMKV